MNHRTFLMKRKTLFLKGKTFMKIKKYIYVWTPFQSKNKEIIYKNIPQFFRVKIILK